jgi:DNA-directed RNA polymerase specialized sigma24 family protein
VALQLHDVRDAEAFANAIANRSQLELGPDDDEDLRQFLLVELWHLSVRYEPSRNRAFSTYAVAILKRRTVDWQRQRHGRTVWKFKDRTYIRRPVELVSLDDGVDHGLLGGAVGAGAGDPADSGDLGLAGVLRDGDRTRARDLEILGL